MEILVYAVSFSLFLVMQALFINGLHYCFQKGNIFYNIAPDFFEKHRGEWWAMNLWGCVRCMSVVSGSISFWACALCIFGFNFYEVLINIFDVFILVSLNFLIYKKL